MPIVPDRPRKHPKDWIMAYWHFDPSRNRSERYDLSNPLAYVNARAAKAAARKAKSDYEKRGVKVLFAIAYPPVGSKAQPYIVNFQGQNPAPSA